MEHHNTPSTPPCDSPDNLVQPVRRPYACPVIEVCHVSPVYGFLSASTDATYQGDHDAGSSDGGGHGGAGDGFGGGVGHGGAGFGGDIGDGDSPGKGWEWDLDGAIDPW